MFISNISCKTVMLPPGPLKHMHDAPLLMAPARPPRNNFLHLINALVAGNMLFWWRAGRQLDYGVRCVGFSRSAAAQGYLFNKCPCVVYRPPIILLDLCNCFS